jgi:HK97 family phage major capsid protein
LHLDFKKLTEKRNTLVGTAKNILAKAEAENRSLTDAEKKDFDGLTGKVEDLGDTLSRAQDLRRMSEIIDAGHKASQAAVPVQQGGTQSPIYFGEQRAYRRNEPISGGYAGPGFGALARGQYFGDWRGAEELRDLMAREQRVMAEGTLSLGGAAVPTPLSAAFIDLVRPKAQCLAAGALVIPFDSATFKLARLTSDISTNFRAENSAIVYTDGGLDTVTLTSRSIAAAVKVSRELLEDSVNADQIIMRSLTQSMALGIDLAILYGSGSSNQPTGIKNVSGLSTISMGASGATPTDYKKVSAAVGNLLAANFVGPFGAIYAPRTAATFDALADTLGQPLRMPPNVEALERYTTSQVPVNLTVGSNTDCSDIFVGKWDQVVLGARSPMILEVSREAADSASSAFTNHQIWIKAVARVDVAMLHSSAVTVVTGVRG